MRPGKYDIEVIRGGTFKVSFIASDVDGPIDFGAIYAGARLQVWPSWVKTQTDMLGDPLYEITTDTGEITIAGTVVIIEIAAEVTKSISFSSGLYTLELYTDDIIEKVDPFMEGTFNVDRERVL